MKILYIGNERRHAQTVARVLRGVSENIPLAWTHSLDQCARYLAQNRDLAALVIDAQIHAGKWPSSLRDLRSLPLRPAIVTIVPEGALPTFDSAAPVPDETVANGATFVNDLPIAVARAVARIRGTQLPSTPPSSHEQPQPQVRLTPEQAVDALLDLKAPAQADVEQNVAGLAAALQHAERRHAAAMAAAQTAHELAATEQLTEQERQFQAQIAAEREKRRTLEEMLSAATSAREEAERRYASALTDAAGQSRELEQRIGQREAELVAQSQRERAALEQKIASADAHLRELQQRHAAATRVAGEFAEQRAHFDRELSRTTLEGNQLRERLLELELALDKARHERESATADIARLTRREADLSSQLASVEGECRTVEGHLSAAVRELEEARESAARERAAAEQTLALTLARETDARATLERKLADIRSAAANVERGLRDEAATVRAQAQEREASLNARLASERLEYDDRLANVRSERDRFEQACTAANDEVQRLTNDLSDARRVIEDTRRELQDANDRQSAEYASLFAAFAVSLVERDERLKEEAVRHDAALQASELARAELQECLQMTLAAGRHDIDQVQNALMAALEALRAAKRRQDLRQNEADRIAEPHEPQQGSGATNLRVVQQPDIAAWQQLSKDASLV